MALRRSVPFGIMRCALAKVFVIAHQPELLRGAFAGQTQLGSPPPRWTAVIVRGSGR